MACVLCVVLGGGAGASADQDSPERALGTWTLQLENDRIAETDRHYTHGTRLAWVSDRTDSGPDWWRRLLARLHPMSDLRTGRIGLALGQNLYTPDDKRSSDLVRDDRPYAAWLYVSGSLHAEATWRWRGTTLHVLDTLELSLGAIGPMALGRETQNGVHRVVHVPPARGWSNQLKNEPGMALVLERKWRSPTFDVLRLQADAIPHVGVSLGNVMTHATSGATIRFGRNLAIDYGPPHIRPSLSGLVAVEKQKELAWYLFAGFGGRLVGRNLFLDGNTFRHSHDVPSKTLVGDFVTGLALAVKGLRITFSYVLRTREFDGQPQDDRFGALSLSVNF